MTENSRYLNQQIEHAIVQYNQAKRAGDSAHADFWLSRWKRLEQALSQV